MDKTRGFTLIELITSVAIVLIMTAVVLSNLPDFRDRASLDTVSQEIAIDIRGAQVFSRGTKSSGTINAKSLFYPYGIYLDKTHDQSFLLFADQDGNQIYSAGDPSASCGDNTVTECQQKYGINAPVIISDISAYDGSGHQTSVRSDGWLTIVFLKDDTEAYFCLNTDASCASNADARVEITIPAKRSGETRKIVIYKNGQVAVTS